MKILKAIISGIIHTVIIITLPLFLALSIILYNLSQPVFYTSVLKDTNLIRTFIEAVNLETNSKIAAEIEEKTKLHRYKDAAKAAEAVFAAAKLEHNRINRTDETESLDAEYEKISALNWENVKKDFKSENGFDLYKDVELTRIKGLQNEIKNYRKANKDEIKKYSRIAEDAEDKYKDALSDLKDAEEDAEKIIKNHNESFTGRIYSDLEKIEPVITEIFNDIFIDTAVLNELKKLTAFMTSYAAQKKLGNIYTTDASQNTFTANDDNIRIKMPGMSFNLITEDKGSTEKGRHLISQILADEIKNTPGIAEKKFFLKLFAFSDTYLAEIIGSKYLAKSGLLYKDGKIEMPPSEITGQKAQLTNYAIMALTAGEYLVFAAAALLLVYILYLIISANNTGKIKALIFISLAIICTSILAITYMAVFNSFPETLAENFKAVFFTRKIVAAAAQNLLLPVIAVFAFAIIICATAGWIKCKKPHSV